MAVVTLVLGRIGDFLEDSSARQRAWAYATATFSVGQAVAAYGYAWLLEQFKNFPIIFVIGATALVLAFLLDQALGRDKRAA